MKERVEAKLGDVASAELATLPIWAERLVRFLDDGFRVPIVGWRFGFDAIIGFFFPAAGDLITSMSSMTLIVLAFKSRVPSSALLRMVLNTLIDVLIGLIQILGDLFDIFFKSNRRNIEILKKHLDSRKRACTFSEYALLTLVFCLSFAVVLIPLGVIWLCLHYW